MRLKLVVLQDQSLNVSLDEFVSLFVAENAPSSYKLYHEMVKDTNVVMTSWEPMTQSLGSGRELRFFKPVNLPGLASTRGVKVQRFVRFGDVGLIVCSSTRLEDVPAADTFSVDDVLAVSSVFICALHSCLLIDACLITGQIYFGRQSNCRDYFSGVLY